MSSRIQHAGLRAKVMSAQEAAAFIRPGTTVGMSGFTGSGYPKAVPLALAERISAAHARGEDFRIDLHTGASTSSEMDGALAESGGVALRTPFQSDPTMRAKINAGEVEYIDTHLSHLAQTVWNGFYGPMHTAVVEVSAIREDGTLVPSSSVGNNKSWLDLADEVILEVNSWQSEELEGLHDVYYGTALPASRTSSAIPPRWSPSSRPTARTATLPLSPPTRTRSRSPSTWWSSSSTRWPPAGTTSGCCRCSPAWATSPTR
jgi:succinyl-CoA:acetate CoA-transferase